MLQHPPAMPAKPLNRLIAESASMKMHRCFKPDAGALAPRPTKEPGSHRSFGPRKSVRAKICSTSSHILQVVHAPPVKNCRNV